MAKEATGEVRQASDGRFSALVRTFGKRETFQLPTCTDRPTATERAALLATIARRFRVAGVDPARGKVALEIVASVSAKSLRDGLRACEDLLGGDIPAPGAKAPTFADVAKQWTTGELARLYPDQVRAKDATGDKARLAHLSAIDVGGRTLGELAIDRVTLDHAETAMRHLPPDVKPATRRHYAQALHRVLALAVYPLRLIPSSPLPKGFLPKQGKPPAFAYVYPTEDAALMAHEATSLGRRVLFGFLAREGPRLSEPLGLRWPDLDLDRGVVTLDKNKTDDPRAWVLGADVTRALRAWRAVSGGKADGPVFSDAGGPFEPKIADRLRTDLQAAGVDRPELYARTEHRSPLRVHDLRGTFVTLALAAGRSETWVADRTGHKSSVMINRYRRAARGAAELGLGWLAPLDFAIPELSPIPGMVAGLQALHCHSIATRGDETESGGESAGGDNHQSLRRGSPCRGRTGTPLLARDFKSPASAIPPRGRDGRSYSPFGGLTTLRRGLDPR